MTICTVVLLRDLPLGSAFQNGSTILKVVLILVIIGAGFWVKGTQPISFLPTKGDGALILSAPFAVSLYWVMYAYSGWNASTYIVGEVRNPSRTIPLSVGLGTVLVMLLYLATNAVFLRTTPAAEMIGEEQVAVIAGAHIFGAAGAKVMASFICLGLVSAISAMMWIGPRITATMGEDLRVLSPLARRNARGIPSDRDPRAVRHRGFAAAHRHLPDGGQLHPVQPHALLGPHGAGRLRPALAAAGIAASLSRLGISGHAGDFPGDQRLDAGPHAEPDLPPAFLRSGVSRRWPLV